MNFLLPLLAMIALCAGWAVFQIWLSRHDPDANRCLRNCGSCSCRSGDDAGMKWYPPRPPWG
jgi:hypothetical protein